MSAPYVHEPPVPPYGSPERGDQPCPTPPTVYVDDALISVPCELLESLVDDDECWFDHHGGCQAHGYLSLQSGEECPQHEAKRRLAEFRTTP